MRKKAKRARVFLKIYLNLDNLDQDLNYKSRDVLKIVESKTVF